MKAIRRSSLGQVRVRSALVEPLEDRRLFAVGLTPAVATAPVESAPMVSTRTVVTGRIAAGRSTVYFNDPVGGARGPNVALSLKNTGTGSLRINGLSVAGTNGTMFQVTSGPNGSALPFTLAAGASATVQLAFNPPGGTGTGIKVGTLTVATNDPTRPTLAVALRGLATAGTGGLLEPSLQRILDMYQIQVRTGDTNPAGTYLFRTSEPRGANDEVTRQALKKAGTGAVTIQPLATFAGGSPSAVVGWYPAGNPGGRKQLFTVAGSTAQSVNPLVSGITTFDPGVASFGLYTAFPFISTTQYSQDSLNTAERTIKRKIRFFPLKQNGVVAANAYVFTTEDWNNDANGGTDSNDFVGVIRNVTLG